MRRSENSNHEARLPAADAVASDEATRRDTPPIDQPWLQAAAFELLRQHRRGETKLNVEGYDSVSKAAEARAQEIWELACSEEAERRQATRRLTGRLKKYAVRAALIMGGLTAMTMEGEKPAIEEQPVVPRAAAEFPKPVEPPVTRVEELPLPTIDIDLTGLDREATPERVRRLLTETFPKGWVGNLENIHYSATEGRVDKSYGLKKAKALADTGEDANGVETITFYRSSLGESETSLRKTLAHELAHTIDWRKSWPFDEEAAKKMEAAVVSRITSPGRFHSSYVESINNPNKKIQEERRTVEYWAEICEEYYSVKDPSEALGTTDLNLIEEAIKTVDPAFDRESALENSRAILDEMAGPQFAGRLEIFLTHLPTKGIKPELQAPADLKERLQRQWLEHRFPASPELRRQGRRALADFLMKWESDETTYKYSLSLIASHFNIDTLATKIGDGRYTYDREFDEGNLDAFSLEKAIKIDESVGKQISAELAILIDRHGFAPKVRLAPGEYATLIEGTQLWSDPTRLVRLMEYEPAAVDRPLKRTMLSRCINPSPAAKLTGGPLSL